LQRIHRFNAYITAQLTLELLVRQDNIYLYRIACIISQCERLRIFVSNLKCNYVIGKVENNSRGKLHIDVAVPNCGIIQCNKTDIAAACSIACAATAAILESHRRRDANHNTNEQQAGRTHYRNYLFHALIAFLAQRPHKQPYNT